jgi:DNA-binding response OmpR family regulator
LIVDDEPLLAQLVGRVLSSAGYLPLVASDSASALRALEGANGRVPIALIDVRLPGQSGAALADVIRTRFPETGILFIAGNPRDAGDPASYALLPKPFTMTELMEAVEDQRRRHRREYLRSAAHADRLSTLIDRVSRQTQAVQGHVTRVGDLLGRAWWRS